MSGFRRKRADARHSVARRLRLEELEPRTLLDAGGVLAGTESYWTLSFASDGTEVAGQQSALEAEFNAIAPTDQWQSEILRAFQSWAVHTNSDIGLVGDSLNPLGSPGAEQSDPRFGDIRIAAIAMDPQVGAVSIPTNSVVSGTWYADVVFNTNFNFTSLSDIFGVALHEAGNVFGLPDNDDPTSPLHPGPIPVATAPNANDILALQALHGSRGPDSNENPILGGGDNGTIASATHIQRAQSASGVEGTAPSIIYGDIQDANDADFYRFETPLAYSGPLTVQLRSQGISLLAPKLRVYDKDLVLLSEQTSTSITGDAFIYQLPSIEGDQRVYFEVAGATPGLYGVGGYSLSVVVDAWKVVAQADIDAVADGTLRFVAHEDLRKVFETGANSLFGQDLHTDDTFDFAFDLDTTAGFAAGTRYQKLASIEDQADADVYRFLSQTVLVGEPNVMTLSVRSSDTARLIPQIELYNDREELVPTTILVNGGGQLVVQASGIESDARYFVKVSAADPAGPFAVGNYELIISAGQVETTLDPLAIGALASETVNEQTLYIARPQLFHIALAVDPVITSAPTILVYSLLSDTGEVLHQIAALPGSVRTTAAVLLDPGTYTIAIRAFALDGNPAPDLGYQVLGKAISDPFVGDPSNPGDHPFDCTELGMEGLFCYPGEFVSPDPFLWDTFISTLPEPPDTPDLATLIGQLIGNWWSWVWSTSGVNGPPLAQGDTTQVQEAGLMAAASGFLAPSGSVLANDFEPEGDPVVAIKKSDPAHGTLVLEPNGTFVYTPDMGFLGRDEFTYAAYDFIQESAVATVSIIVGVSGDFNADGNVTGLDFLAWQRNVGLLGGAILTDGDSNFDGNVDAADLGVWESELPTTSPPGPSGGDANGNGIVEGFDFLAWQRGVGISSGALASDGDADADGDVDTQDLLIWESNYGGPPLIVLSPFVVAVDPASSPAQGNRPSALQSVSTGVSPGPTLAAATTAVSSPGLSDVELDSNASGESTAVRLMPISIPRRHAQHQTPERPELEAELGPRLRWLATRAEAAVASVSHLAQLHRESSAHDRFFAEFQSLRFSEGLDELEHELESIL